MRLLSASPEALVFRLSSAERGWFTKILRCYPVVPASHATLTRGQAPGLREHEPLLREALAEQRDGLRRRIATWLAAADRWPPADKGHRLSVPRGDGEWLLQVLNDVRVGSWLRLGSPEELPRDPAALAPERQLDFAQMELSGAFEMILLESMEAEPGS